MYINLGRSVEVKSYTFLTTAAEWLPGIVLNASSVSRVALLSPAEEW